MRKLIILLIATAGLTQSAQANCVIQGVLKKEKAKTIYVNSVSMSLKKLTEAGCIIKSSVLSKSDVKKLNVAVLEAKLKKARAK